MTLRCWLEADLKKKKEAAHLVIKSFCHWGAQISQIWLNVSIHNLLVVNVNLQKTELFLTLIRYKNQVMPETLFRVLNKKKNLNQNTMTIEWSGSQRKTGKKEWECLKGRRREWRKPDKSPRTQCVGTWSERHEPHQSDVLCGNERSDSADEGGGIIEAERELPRMPHSTTKSINMFDLPPRSISLTSF